MCARYAGVEHRVSVPQSYAEFEGCAVDVGGGYGVVGALVEVVAVGYIYLRAFERLVVEAELQSRAPHSAPFLELIGYLCAHSESFVQAYAFLFHLYAYTEAMFAELERHVGHAHECLRRIVDAYPLKTGAGAYAHQVGLAYGRGVVVRRHFVILRQLRVGLCVGFERKGCRYYAVNESCA